MEPTKFTEVIRRKPYHKQEQPSYSFVSESAVEDDPNVGQSTDVKRSLRNTWGDIPVVTASFDLLLKFCNSNLLFLSKQTEDKFGAIVSWAKQIVENGKTFSFRMEMHELVEDVAHGPRLSACKYLLGCELRTSDDGTTYPYSHWMSGKHKVPEDVLESNTLMLQDARVNHLFHQICFRLEKITYRLKKEEKCDLDSLVRDGLTKALATFDKYRTESLVHMNSLNELKSALRASYGESNQTPVRSKIVGYIPPPGAPKKQAQPPVAATKNSTVARKLDFTPKAPLPNVVKEKGFSFASVVKANPVVEKPTTIENPVSETNSKPVEKECNEVVEGSPMMMNETSDKPLVQSKSAKKRAQKKRTAEKKAAGNSDLVDVAKEEPSKALELGSEPLVPEQTPEFEMVEMLCMEGGKAFLKKVMMTKAELAKMRQ